MSEVKRYFVGETIDEDVPGSEQGYVLHADYARLEAIRDDLRRGVKE